MKFTITKTTETPDFVRFVNGPGFGAGFYGITATGSWYYLKQDVKGGPILDCKEAFASSESYHKPCNERGQPLPEPTVAKGPALEVEFTRVGSAVTVRVLRQTVRSTDLMIEFGRIGKFAVYSCSVLELYDGILYLHGEYPDKTATTCHYDTEGEAIEAVAAFTLIIEAYTPPAPSPVVTVARSKA